MSKEKKVSKIKAMMVAAFKGTSPRALWWSLMGVVILSIVISIKEISILHSVAYLAAILFIIPMMEVYLAMQSHKKAKAEKTAEALERKQVINNNALPSNYIEELDKALRPDITQQNAFLLETAIPMLSKMYIQAARSKKSNIFYNDVFVPVCDLFKMLRNRNDWYIKNLPSQMYRAKTGVLFFKLVLNKIDLIIPDGQKSKIEVALKNIPINEINKVIPFHYHYFDFVRFVYGEDKAQGLGINDKMINVKDAPELLAFFREHTPTTFNAEKTVMQVTQTKTKPDIKEQQFEQTSAKSEIDSVSMANDNEVEASFENVSISIDGDSDEGISIVIDDDESDVTDKLYHAIDQFIEERISDVNVEGIYIAKGNPDLEGKAMIETSSFLELIAELNISQEEAENIVSKGKIILLTKGNKELDGYLVDYELPTPQYDSIIDIEVDFESNE